MNYDLIIKGKYVLPMDSELSIIHDGLVAVLGNRIIKVGKAGELAGGGKAKEIIDAGNSIIMPGLVNTHTHAAMAYFRGLADDLPLEDWLNKHIWPAEAKYLKPDFIRQSAELACLEMIKSGTTCFNDMYFFENITAEVAERFGLRAMLGEGILDFPTPSSETPDDAILRTLELNDKYRKSRLIRATLAPHSIYTCSKKVLIKVKKLCKKHDLPIHIHLCETKKEVDDSVRERWLTPVEYLDKFKFFSSRVIAAHSVWLDDNDLKILKYKKVKVSHCPMSNMKLGSGVAMLPKMIENDITVGLGTDSAASNNTLDLFSDMRACALLHKVNNLDPTLVNARQAVKMATIDGAKVLGLDKKIGSLETGKRADMITINLDQPHLAPLFDPYSHLVYCVNSADVNNVIIDGRIVMRDRQVANADEKEIIEQANKFKI